jgi:hypothetical protein
MDIILKGDHPSQIWFSSFRVDLNFTEKPGR